jgi:hypothetical protein
MSRSAEMVSDTTVDGLYSLYAFALPTTHSIVHSVVVLDVDLTCYSPR